MREEGAVLRCKRYGPSGRTVRSLIRIRFGVGRTCPGETLRAGHPSHLVFRLIFLSERSATSRSRSIWLHLNRNITTYLALLLSGTLDPNRRLTQPSHHSESDANSPGQPGPGEQPEADHQTDRYQEALAFLYDRINYEKLVDGASRYPFRLRRIADLLCRLELSHFLDRPHLPTPVKGTPGPLSPEASPVPMVHIAGTKGKGSTATMVASVLTESGIRTGNYTSPHLHRLEERFRIDGEPCSPTELIALVDRVRNAAEQMAGESAGSPTFFELTTAIALLHFHRRDCQVVVLEVGLGGRLDSTNVCRPTVSAITSIGLDHQHVLGDTKEAIAGEKAGIIKAGVPVISSVVEKGPADVISQIATQQNAPLYQLDRDFAVSHSCHEDWGSLIEFDGRDRFQGYSGIHVSLEGSHQARNASLALAILQMLESRTNIRVGSDAIRKAMSRLPCEGRIQRYQLARSVTVIIDSAHNEDSIGALCQAIRSRSYSEPISFVFGTSIDKTAEPMLRLISELADSITLTQFSGNPRFYPVESLAKEMPEDFEGTSKIENDAMLACQAALASVPDGGTLIVCGSFFLAAEVQGYFESLRLPP